MPKVAASSSIAWAKLRALSAGAAQASKQLATSSAVSRVVEV